MDSLFAQILDAAQRAPSAHNTQPWKLRWWGDRLDVFVSEERMIPAIDSSGTDLLHSLGAMIENVILTLGHLGLAAQYEVAREISCEVPVIRLSWEKSRKPFQEEDLYYQIPLRRTSRLPYQKDSVEESLILKMEKYLLTPCKMYWTQDPRKISSIRKLVAFATVQQLKDREIAAELYEWTRFSRKDPRWYRDGLNAACMGWNRIESKIYKHLLHPKRLAWLSKSFVFEKLYYSERQSAPLSPAVILVTLTAEDNPHNRILAGRSLQRLWLAASHAGLTTHPISAGVDVTLTRDRIKTLMESPLNERHVSLFRLGKSAPCARSPRLTADEIVILGS